MHTFLEEGRRRRACVPGQALNKVRFHLSGLEEERLGAALSLLPAVAGRRPSLGGDGL